MSKILIGLEEIAEHFQPLFYRLNKLEETQLKQEAFADRLFSDKEAASFLKMSTKKLQNLRNKREISFSREPMGRKVTYLYSHLMAYVKKNEIKASNKLSK